MRRRPLLTMTAAGDHMTSALQPLHATRCYSGQSHWDSVVYLRKHGYMVEGTTGQLLTQPMNLSLCRRPRSI